MTGSSNQSNLSPFSWQVILSGIIIAVIGTVISDFIINGDRFNISHASTNADETSPTSILGKVNIEKKEIENIIYKEIDAVCRQDLATIEKLFSSNATIVDQNKTHNNPKDDTFFNNKEGVERFYMNLFSFGWKEYYPIKMNIEISDNLDKAIVKHQGIIVDSIVYPDPAIYTLEKQEGRWLIVRLEVRTQ